MGDADKSKCNTMNITIVQQLLEQEADLKKKLEAEICHGEELKAMEKNCDEKILKGDFKGLGLEELESSYDNLAKFQATLKNGTT